MSRALTLFSRSLGRIWFRTLRREGPQPPPGPVLLLLNHPNGLLDPLTVCAVLEPPPRFLAKSTLWKLLPLRPFLPLFNPIPVYRAQDGEGGDAASRAAANARTFAAAHAALAAGQTVGLFPEGVSHGNADLSPIKTGAARIALSSPVPPAIVPAGLVYGDRRLFRHGALLRLGEPIAWEDLRGRGADPEAVQVLTGRIREALYPLTLHDPEAERLRLAQDLAWLLAEAPGSRADLDQLRNRVQSLRARLAKMDEEELGRLRHRVRAAQRWLRARGLRPDQVGHPYPFEEVARWVPRAALRLSLLPLLLPFGLLFWPPYRLVGWAAKRFTDELDQTATYKLLGAVVFFPLWMALLMLLGHRFVHWSTGFVAVPLAALLAFLCLPLLERLEEDWQAIRGFRHRRAPAVKQLLEAREQLLKAFPGLG